MTGKTRFFKDGAPKIAVCPWQYYACGKPEPERCPVRPWPDREKMLDEYLKRVSEALGCHWVGRKLTESQWRHQRLGVRV